MRHQIHITCLPSETQYTPWSAHPSPRRHPLRPLLPPPVKVITSPLNQRPHAPAHHEHGSCTHTPLVRPADLDPLHVPHSPHAPLGCRLPWPLLGRAPGPVQARGGRHARGGRGAARAAFRPPVRGQDWGQGQRERALGRGEGRRGGLVGRREPWAAAPAFRATGRCRPADNDVHSWMSGSVGIKLD